MFMLMKGLLFLVQVTFDPFGCMNNATEILQILENLQR